MIADGAAVRSTLDLPPDEPIATSPTSPKKELDRLWDMRRVPPEELEFSDMLERLARAVNTKLLEQVRGNGFSEFADDVRSELGPIA